MELDYRLVDVFTDTPYAGNPLAVVLAADDLDTGRMRTIAREFGLSETVFVLRPTGSADYRVRIFTPTAELPFAGHPSVGVAATLAREGLVPEGDLVQECGAGNLPVRATAAEATISGGEPSVGPDLDPAPLLAAAGLTEADLADPRTFPVRSAGAGTEHVLLPVTPDAVARAELDLAAARRHGSDGSDGSDGVDKVYVVAWDPGQRRAHARLFAPGLGITEDPATGSAALALGVWLAAAGLVGDGTTAYTVAQGSELGRPSVLRGTVRVEGGSAVATTVAGDVAPVGRGRIRV